MLVAQFTDPHITGPGGRTCGGEVDTIAGLRRAIDTLHGLADRPDCLLVTGDLTDQGRPEEYRVLRDLLADVEIPVHLAIGNHDDRVVMQAELDLPPLQDHGAFVQYCVEDHPVRLIVLDSASDEHHMGELCERRLAWLKDRLAEQPEQPTLIAVHHPPFDTGIAFLDGEGPGWAEGLVAALSRSPQVELVVSGHVHRSIQTVVGGRLATVCPSTAQQTTLDLADGPSADHLFTAEPSGFQVHCVGDGPAVTHTVPVGEFDGLIAISEEGRARWAAMEVRDLLAKGREHAPGGEDR